MTELATVRDYVVSKKKKVWQQQNISSNLIKHVQWYKLNLNYDNSEAKKKKKKGIIKKYSLHMYENSNRKKKKKKAVSLLWHEQIKIKKSVGCHHLQI